MSWTGASDLSDVSLEHGEQCGVTGQEKDHEDYR
jgi:hypothetical protein